jgi:hypothetical protein
MCPENRQFYLGTSGWAHRDWIGKLYPHDTPRYLDLRPALWYCRDRAHVLRDAHKRNGAGVVWRTPERLSLSMYSAQITHGHRLHNAQEICKSSSMSSAAEDKLALSLQLPEDSRYQELQS